MMALEKMVVRSSKGYWKHTICNGRPVQPTTHNKGIMNAISAIALACGKIGGD